MSTPYYVTVAQLKAFRPPESTEAIDFSDWDDDQLEAVINEVEALAESICNDRWRVATETVYANGNGRHKLSLPADAGHPYPVQTVTSITEVDFDGTTEIQTFVYGTDYRFEAGAYYLFTNDTVPTRVRNAIGKLGVWPLGTKNIKIVGTFGKTSVPQEVSLAIKYLATARTLGAVGAGLEGTGENAVQEQWSDYMITYSRSGDARRKSATLPYLTGYAKADQLLAKHVNHVDMFMLL